MGIPPDVLAAIISAGGSALGGALSPNPYQHRNSYANTSVSGQNWLTDLHSLLGVVTPVATGRAISPVDLTSSMPNTADLPSFEGGGLPIRIGVQGTSQHPIAGGGSSGGGGGQDLPVTPLPTWGPDRPPSPFQPLPGAGPWNPGREVGVPPSHETPTSIPVSGGGESGPRRISRSPGEWGTGTTPLAGGSQTQAQGAAQLLLHALMGNQSQQQPSLPRAA